MRRHSNTAAGTAYLLVTALIFGSSFFIVKTSVDVFPPCWLIGLRFTAASAFLCLLFHRRLRNMTAGTVRAGIIIGVFLLAAYVAQTIGITDTTPGRNAFLTALYVVLVPFIGWGVFHRLPERRSIVAAFVCIAGIALISLDSALRMSMGDALSLLGGVMFAAQIVAIAAFAKDHDPVLLTIVQLGVCGISGLVLGWLTEPVPAGVNAGSIAALVYLSIMVSGVAFLMQNIGQTLVTPSLAGILLSLEAVFGVVFSVLFYQEELTGRVTLGFVLVFAAILISELKFPSLRRRHAAP